MKFYSDVIMWTLTFALPCATLGLPVPSPSYGSQSKEHPSRTMLSSSPSSFLAFFRPSLSSSSSSVSSSVSSTTTGIVTFDSPGTSVSRTRRAAKVPQQSMEPVISGVQQKAGTDLKASDSADLKTTPTPSLRRRHRKNRGSKKRPKSKKRRRRRKCPKKDKKQRRRKHRKCSRSRKSRRRNGKKRRNRKSKKGKSERREKKKRRQVTKDNSVNLVSEKPEIVKNQKVVKPAEAIPRDFNSTKVAVLFDKASPLEHVQQQKELKPSRISHKKLASAYDSSRPLSANHFTNIQQNRNSNETISSTQKHFQISESKQERFKRSTVLLKRLPSLQSGSYSNSDVLSLSSNEKTTSMLKAVSNF